MLLTARLLSDWTLKADGSSIVFTKELIPNNTLSAFYDFCAKQ
jgi:hypothetical protein